MEIQGSRTEQNLWASFNGESAARAKYSLYAGQARRENLHRIAAVFDETAENELAHAKLWLRALGRLGATEDNLAAAMDAERFEWTHMYAEFERVAREEGFDDIAGQFGYAAAVEREHEARFRGLWERLRQGTLFMAPAPRRWRCRNCGYIHTGNAAPEICPLCAHPRGWYEWDAGWCERLE